jgi:hypothetical protein
MNIIEKDITTVEFGYIIHQCNLQGAFGGLAGSIKNKWPQVFIEYKAYLNEFKNDDDSLLGDFCASWINSDLCVVNFFGQNHYGYGKRQTSYGAWEKGLPNLKGFTDCFPRRPVYFPYLVGCFRGGGDFEIMSRLILETYPEAIFCRI